MEINISEFQQLRKLLLCKFLFQFETWGLLFYDVNKNKFLDLLSDFIIYSYLKA